MLPLSTFSPSLIPNLRVQRHTEPTRQRLVRRYCRRTPCRTQQYHIRNSHIANIIPKRPAHSQCRPIVHEFNHRRRGLRDRYPVIEVQRSGRGTVEPWRNDEIKIKLTQCGGRIRAVGAERKNGTAFDVDGNLSEIRVDGDGRAGTAEGFVSEKVVELVIGEVDGCACSALFRHGRD